MDLPALTSGRIMRRYQRFLADVVLDSGVTVTAHCPNTGAMHTCWQPGAAVQLSFNDSPSRKLRWTLERVDMGGGWIGVHTGRVNAVVAEALASGRVADLAGYARLRREVTWKIPGHPVSRLDMVLSEGHRPDAYVEVKNTTLLDGETVRFPDAVTERGRRHLDALLTAVAAGHRGVMVYAVNRPEGTRFAPAPAMDPAYAARLREVAAAGVELLALRILHTPRAMSVGPSLPVDLDI
jgi:sugar fermentation stimulation protein A